MTPEPPVRTTGAPERFCGIHYFQPADVFPMEYADILERHKVLHEVAGVAGTDAPDEALRRIDDRCP